MGVLFADECGGDVLEDLAEGSEEGSVNHLLSFKKYMRMDAFTVLMGLPTHLSVLSQASALRLLEEGTLDLVLGISPNLLMAVFQGGVGGQDGD